MKKMEKETLELGLQIQKSLKEVENTLNSLEALQHARQEKGKIFIIGFEDFTDDRDGVYHPQQYAYIGGVLGESEYYELCEQSRLALIAALVKKRDNLQLQFDQL